MRPVSPKLTAARYWARMPFQVLLFIGLVWWAWSSRDSGHAGWWALAVAAGAGYLLWLAWLIPRQVENIGWLETEDELLITKGKIWRTLTVVPYGRIQFVDVTEGPIAQRYGLKNLTLNTASATSDTSVPGLPAAEADALRDRLAVRARERMSGL